MSTTLILLSCIVFGIVVLLAAAWFTNRLPRRRGGLDKDYFQTRWLDVLAKVKTQEGMVLAVIDSDKLLDEALKRRHFKGRTMGERMVSAQQTFTDNDATWYAHKLRNRLVHEADIKLKENEAKRALAGMRQGLKDLGAL